MHSGLVLLVVAVLARWQFVLALVTARLAAVHLWLVEVPPLLAALVAKCCCKQAMAQPVVMPFFVAVLVQTLRAVV